MSQIIGVGNVLWQVVCLESSEPKKIVMISRLLLIALAASVTLTSCDAELLKIARDFAATPIVIDVPATDEPGSVAVSREDIETELRGKLEDFDISEDQLKSVVVKSAVATINDPSGNLTFDDLKDMALVLSNETMGDVTIAKLPSGTGNTAEFDVEDTELKEYLLSDTFDAKLGATSSEAIGEGVTVSIKVDYSVTGGL